MKHREYKNFSPEIQAKIEELLQSLNASDKTYAVFDADGTLWDFDLGEVFFQYQIDNELVNLPKNPMQYYRTMKKSNPKAAYLWLAQINEGVKIDTLRGWAKACVEEYGELPFFPAIKTLIQKFLAKNINIYVVTASVKWAVEPGAAVLGIPKEQVLGVQTSIDNGLITSEQKGPITYREGKAKAFFYESQGESPIFVAGNTLGDYDLLETSKGLRLCLQSAAEGSELRKSEEELKQKAIEKGWLCHEF
tara:strand:- start:5362 stop:6108 length:747 start_codon:yes stop_codon:yes gene_type:complete